MTTRARILAAFLFGMIFGATLAPLGWIAGDAYASRTARERGRMTCATFGGIAVEDVDGFQVCVLQAARKVPDAPHATEPQEVWIARERST